ncbi:Hypothetical protein D9617_11g010000 [Elsinoe fawcettii]|nr:Hypothetical protein D9617_11g010000 [Elsinoe fawcettii]
MDSLTSTIALLIPALGLVSASLAMPEKRAVPPAVNAEVCLNTCNPNASKQGRLIKAKGASWVPDCHKLPCFAAEAACVACQDTAIATWVAAIAACTDRSFICAICAIIEPYCEATCAAVATYTLYGAAQKCYCLHADCSDKANRPPNTRLLSVAPSFIVDGDSFSGSVLAMFLLI